MPARVPPRLRTKTALIVLSTLIAVLLAEGLARVIGIRPLFGELIFVREASTRSVDGVPLWADKHPRADDEDVRRAAADRSAFKVVGLGDSIMYGVWLTREQTYLEQARDLLAKRSPRRVEVLNLAVPGYNTLQEDAVYKEIEGQIQPDLVLVHYWPDNVHQYREVGGYVVDFGNVSEDGHVAGALPLPAAMNDFLLVHSRLYDVMTQAAVALDRKPEAVDWTRVSKPLLAIQERAQRGGGRVILLASPELDGEAPRPTVDLPMVQEFASTHGIEVIDLSQWLHGVRAKEIALDRCHFNAEGHRLIGEHLAEYLLQHDLHDQASPR